jgi:hypothetical protein
MAEKKYDGIFGEDQPLHEAPAPEDESPDGPPSIEEEFLPFENLVEDPPGSGFYRDPSAAFNPFPEGYDFSGLPPKPNPLNEALDTVIAELEQREKELKTAAFEMMRQMGIGAVIVIVIEQKQDPVAALMKKWGLPVDAEIEQMMRTWDRQMLETLLNMPDLAPKSPADEDPLAGWKKGPGSDYSRFMGYNPDEDKKES